MIQAIKTLYRALQNHAIDKKAYKVAQQYRIKQDNHTLDNVYHRSAGWMYEFLARPLGGLEEYALRKAQDHQSRIQESRTMTLEETIESLKEGNFADQQQAGRLEILSKIPKPKTLWQTIKDWWKEYRIDRWEYKMEKRYGEGFYYVPEEHPLFSR